MENSGASAGRRNGFVIKAVWRAGKTEVVRVAVSEGLWSKGIMRGRRERIGGVFSGGVEIGVVGFGGDVGGGGGGVVFGMVGWIFWWRWRVGSGWAVASAWEGFLVRQDEIAVEKDMCAYIAVSQKVGTQRKTRYFEASADGKRHFSMKAKLRQQL